ncbi:MAG: hypothetical protein WCD79_20660 [Chthoniobacteraceae bacterium]
MNALRFVAVIAILLLGPFIHLIEGSTADLMPFFSSKYTIYKGKPVKVWIDQIADPDPAKSDEALIAFIDFFHWILPHLDAAAQSHVRDVLLQVHGEGRRDKYNIGLAAFALDKYDLREAGETDIPCLFEFLRQFKSNEGFDGMYRRDAVHILLRLKTKYPDQVDEAENSYRVSELGEIVIHQKVYDALNPDLLPPP